MEVFPIGVDTQIFKPKPDEHYAVREEWPRLLYIGRFYRHKGVLQAVQAFSAVVQNFPKARLTIIGSRGDSTIVDDLVNLIKQYHLEDL